MDKLVTELGKNVFGGKAGKKFMSDFYRKVETNINFLFIICSTLPRKILLFVANKEENWRVILPENY